MAYDQTIPKATDRLKDSQPQLLANFAAIKTLVDINHVTFDDASGDQGKHKWVSFPSQGSAPVFLAGEEGLYNLVYATTVKNELFVHRQTGATTAETPFTASLLSTDSAPAANTEGWSWLPSGLLIKWGRGGGTGAVTVTYPVGATIPAFTQVLNVQITTLSSLGSDSNTFARLRSDASNLSFTAWCSPRTTTGSAAVNFTYLAIGY